MAPLVEGLLRAFIPPPSGWVVVLIIAGLAVWTGWSLFREFTRLNHERHEVLEAAKRKISETSESIDACEALRQWAYHSELRNTLTALAVRAILTMREARNPDMEAVLTMMDYSEASRLNLARSTPNWLLLIGIGGTVIGLASAVVPLAPQIQSAVGALDPTQASASMAAALESMRHAFACSLWGITAAVLVSVLTRKVASQQQQTIAAIQEFVLGDLSSRLLPKSEAIQIEEVQKTLEAGKQFLKDVAQEIQRTSTMMQSAADQFNAVLVNTVQRMEEIGANLNASASQIQQTLLDATRSVETSAAKLNESTKSLIQSSEQLRTHHSNLEIAHRKLQELYSSSVDDLREIAQSQIDQIGQYRMQIVDRLVAVSSDLKDVHAKLRESTEESFRHTREVKQVIQASFENFSESLSRILSQYVEVSHQAEQALRQIVRVLDEFRATVNLPPSEVLTDAAGTTVDAHARVNTLPSSATIFASEEKRRPLLDQSPSLPSNSGRGLVSINHPTDLRERKSFWSFFRKLFRMRGDN